MNQEEFIIRKTQTLISYLNPTTEDPSILHQTLRIMNS